MKIIFSKQVLCICMAFLSLSCGYANKNSIQPWKKNPHYWQYKGKPVLLIGGTNNDNLFQQRNLKGHLDSLYECGGNYIRNTMSDRDIYDGNLRAFKKTKNKYDLIKWNPGYWERFENLLKWSKRRGIIVQIEVWDRFDHSRNEWKTDPYNPKNNVNYTYEQTSLRPDYPHHPGTNEQPFFFTVPELNNNKILLKFQQRFVDKMLSISLKYKNVLYCIDNETNGNEKWGQYWAKYIKEKAGKKKIFITEMWDNWNVGSSIKMTYNHPDIYNFIDISQNSHQIGYSNWKNAQQIFSITKSRPCPVNSVKIYGSKTRNQKIDEQDGIYNFFKNLMGGFASSRFHRPPSGLGLSDKSMACMSLIRKIENKIKFWDMEPVMNLLKNPTNGKSYITKSKKGSYLLYITDKNSVQLNLNENKLYNIQWIGLKRQSWVKKQNFKGNEEIIPPFKKNSFAIINEE